MLNTSAYFFNFFSVDKFAISRTGQHYIYAACRTIFFTVLHNYLGSDLEWKGVNRIFI